MKRKTWLSILLLGSAVGLLRLPFPPLDAQPPAPTPQSTTLHQRIGACDPRIPIGELPFAITTPGSYYLVGDLTGPMSSDGITISFRDVTIDLNGFTLRGPAAGSTETGIAVVAGVENVTIENGILERWPGSAIDASLVTNGRFERLQLANDNSSLQPGRGGLLVGSSCIVRECSSAADGGCGIRATGSQAFITACVVSHTTGVGISIEGRSTVRECTVMRCSGAGIQSVGGLSSVLENELIENDIGIEVLAGRNRIDGNHLLTNHGCGISVVPGSTKVEVVRNHAVENNPNYCVPASCGFVSSSCASATANPWANLDY